MALVKRPSAASGSRRTNPQVSSRFTRWDRRESDALVTAASWLIRRVWPGSSDNLARAWYSAKLRPASPSSWTSKAHGSLVNTVARERQATCWSSSSQFASGEADGSVRFLVAIYAILRAALDASSHRL